MLRNNDVGECGKLNCELLIRLDSQIGHEISQFKYPGDITKKVAGVIYAREDEYDLLAANTCWAARPIGSEIVTWRRNRTCGFSNETRCTDYFRLRI